MKYFKPISWHRENKIQNEQEDDELRKKLISRFVKINREKSVEIETALSAGDIKLAHRLADTLKSNAGQLNKTLLQQVAGEIEDLLKNGENTVSPWHLTRLEIELNAVLTELTPLIHESERTAAADTLNLKAMHELLEELEPLLENGNSDCLTFIDRLQLIPGSETLITQIDNLDFDLALTTLIELKTRLE